MVENSAPVVPVVQVAPVAPVGPTAAGDAPAVEDAAGGAPFPMRGTWADEHAEVQPRAPVRGPVADEHADCGRA